MLWVVEAWRGIASALVLWAHWAAPLGLQTEFASFAFTGVDLFFVLSGFVFAPLLLKSPTPSLRGYVLRRVVRIYPAYLAALLLYAWLAWFAGRPLVYLPEHVLMAHLQSREMAFYYNPAFWSLPVEVGFYALIPVLGAWLAQARLLRAWARWPILCVLALTLRVVLLVLADGTTQNLAYVLLNHIPGLLVEFLLGTWVWQRAQLPLNSLTAWVWGTTGVVGWFMLAVLFANLPETVPAWLSGQLGVAAAVCFAASLLASLQIPKPDKSLLAAAQWSGRLSYSVYLLHMAWLTPALMWSNKWGLPIGTTVALAGLLGSCLLLHWCIEEPARRVGRSHAQQWERQDIETGRV